MDYKEQKHIVQTYKKFDIVLERGEGAYLFDDKGKAYLDFASGIGVLRSWIRSQSLQHSFKSAN